VSLAGKFNAGHLHLDPQNMSDYIMTIGSDVEDATPISNPMGSHREDDGKLDLDFVFDVSGDPYFDFATKEIGVEDLVMTGIKLVWLPSQI
jgi:ATP-dependent RNA helicase DDX27